MSAGPDFFARQALTFRNEMRQSCAALVGIVQGLLADGSLNDAEVRFLSAWLHNNQSVSTCWPGSVIAAQIETILADGHIGEEERLHLVDVLQKLVGGTLDDLAQQTHVCELPLDQVSSVEIAARRFCLTGDFCFGSRSACQAAIEARGGLVANSVSKKLDYLVVGGLGSAEWKHGNFGTKIERAVELRTQGARLLIVHEDPWAAALMER